MMRRLILRVAITIVLACAGLIGTAQAAGTILPRGAQIAFVSQRHGSNDIYLMEVDRGLFHRVTSGPANNHTPLWSPDGRYLVFESNRVRGNNLFIIDMERDRFGEPERITSNWGSERLNAIWSPDGTPLLSVVNMYNRNQDIYLLDLTTPKPIVEEQRLTRSRHIDYHLNWTASEAQASEIAFVSPRNNNHDIYVVDVLTGDERRLTDHPAIDSAPSWSPDGARIAFHSFRNGHSNIYIMDAYGGNLIRMTDTRGTDWYPVWSPDGRHIAFTSVRDGNSSIYVMDALIPFSDRLLSDHQAAERDPVWSPDGERLIFVSYRNGNAELYVINVDGTGLRRLTHSPAEDTRPVWRPR